ncbi:MAG TPA: hypothetical protein VHC69_05715 [Polyangiaceae bacterium]|nr:hypothetical protein [Polyangiaceae bacterium]
MPQALVAVEIAPPDAAPPLKQSLLDACSRAAEERCAEPQGEQEPNVVAIVSWKDALHARVEVALRREQRWVVRTMGFGAQDAAEERWKAVGLVIGTLASLMAHNKEPPPPEVTTPPPAPKDEPPEPAPEAAPPPAEPPKPVSLPPPPAPPEPDHVVLEPLPAPKSVVAARRGFVGAAFVVGSALDRGSPRLGAELDGHLLLGSDVYALVGAAYSASAARVDGVETSFVEAFLGLSYARDLGASFTGVLHAEALGERFSPSIEDGGGGPTSGERWLGGARFGGDLYYWGANPAGFFVGAAAKWTAGATDVVADGAYVGSAPALGYVVRAGAAFGFR